MHESHLWRVPIVAPYCGRCAVLHNQPGAKVPCTYRRGKGEERMI